VTKVDSTRVGRDWALIDSLVFFVVAALLTLAMSELS
jgi:hypothetical protein